MSAATQNEDELVVTFAEQFLQIGGTRIRYLEAGQGHPVVVLYDKHGMTSSRLPMLLASQFRVIVVEMPNDARTLTNVVVALGLEQYGLISTGASALLALWHALDAPQRVDALVLISPIALLPNGWTAPGGATRDPALERQLGDIHTATLVLIGTRDQVLPAEIGRLYVERLLHCYYALVYDAGHEIEAERPEALFAAVRDFLEQRDTFVVSRQQTVINP